MTAAAMPRAVRPDPWVAGAAAVRLAVLTAPGVVALAESAAFQTHGPGAPVEVAAHVVDVGGAV